MPIIARCYMPTLLTNHILTVGCVGSLNVKSDYTNALLLEDHLLPKLAHLGLIMSSPTHFVIYTHFLYSVYKLAIVFT